MHFQIKILYSSPPTSDHERTLNIDVGSWPDDKGYPKKAIWKWCKGSLKGKISSHSHIEMPLCGLLCYQILLYPTQTAFPHVLLALLFTDT